MIKLNLQMFAKTASQMRAYRASIKMAKNQMPGKKSEQASGETGEKPKRSESFEDVERRITNDKGYVNKIEYGQKYTIFNSNRDGEKLNQFGDQAMTAADVKEWLEDYSYNEKTGTFTNGYKHYLVKLERKKKN